MTRHFKLKVCFICGKEILNKRKRNYCSIECQKIGNKVRVLEYNNEMRALNKKLRRCIYCGTDLPDSKYLLCENCRKKQRELVRNGKNKKTNKKT